MNFFLLVASSLSFETGKDLRNFTYFINVKLSKILFQLGNLSYKFSTSCLEGVTLTFDIPCTIF